mmetsp:Transcript_97959/g.204337  ORF Transcript_97959/g.204337 Transcript_97959/m.204337 type:complete len:207 (-) Transcript_97959:279-899(-)|eukprot:CAMPEP_0206427332 /NCGR_PEP_ID=MMETSP0324_2-20121206/4964_1 /ASSEMBLY_ACC=CAM_ASM_000836 /TAXON_ID=2866 /ORGANISM="Crypthecodinium cohnii, Strain Seligo" /LENGTH=206 /DNA_ID=CAMNT_0053892565 /DNA_START=34 /DNA_END=654 /DNA_ORIENTATION=-
MEGFDNESANTDVMRQHQLRKANLSAPQRMEAVDLMMCTDLIDRARCEALNSDHEQATMLEILQANPSDKVLVSDGDSQLLLKIFFKERVDITRIKLRFDKHPEVKEGDDVVYGKPNVIKFYADKGDMTFDDCEACKPADEYRASDENTPEVERTCAGRYFRRLESLVVFVESAFGSEEDDQVKSFINRLSIIGHQAIDYHAVYKS